MERLRLSLRRSEDFIAEAAHRVRTPLATVRVQAEIALRTVSDETEKERLRRIIRAVDESARSAVSCWTMLRLPTVSKSLRATD